MFVYPHSDRCVPLNITTKWLTRNGTYAYSSYYVAGSELARVTLGHKGMLALKCQSIAIGDDSSPHITHKPCLLLLCWCKWSAYAPFGMVKSPAGNISSGRSRNTASRSLFSVGDWCRLTPPSDHAICQSQSKAAQTGRPVGPWPFGGQTRAEVRSSEGKEETRRCNDRDRWL